jgi:nitronate monooxygenase
MTDGMRSLLARIGLSLPIVQAPMAGVQDSRLAIAVSNAGGLGSLPAAMLTPEALRRELAAVRDGTSRPYNVNFFCHAVPEPDPAREAAWLALLAPYYAELHLPPVPADGPARQPFDGGAAEVLAAFEPPVVSFHFGLPAESLLARVRGWRPCILATATSVAEAQWLEERGVDAVIAQGVEAGGHRGSFLAPADRWPLGTVDLVRAIAAAVRIPVIAAGGIADAGDVRAVIAAGAVAAQVGSAYLRCPEATTSALHREALADTGARHTALTNVFTGRSARGIINRLIRELGPMHGGAPAFPNAAAFVTPLRQRAEQLGRIDFSPLWAGAKGYTCREVPAASVTVGLADAVPG